MLLAPTLELVARPVPTRRLHRRLAQQQIRDALDGLRSCLHGGNTELKCHWRVCETQDGAFREMSEPQNRSLILVWKSVISQSPWQTPVYQSTSK